MRLGLQFSSGLFVLAAFSTIGNAADVTVGTVTAHAGQKTTGFFTVPAGSDSGAEIPVIIINGAKPGPILGLISGSHGTEYGSIVALPKLAQAINPAELSGTLIILPLVNVASFLQKVPHRNPIDNKGMNNYPGKSDGSQSERIVAAVYNQVINNVTT